MAISWKDNIPKVSAWESRCHPLVNIVGRAVNKLAVAVQRHSFSTETWELLAVVVRSAGGKKASPIMSVR